MKKCKDCNLIKDSKEFYGKQGECKDCTKKRIRLREEKLKLDKNWIEKERKRQRDKYFRLNYKNSQKIWDKDKVWKNTSTYKNQNRNLKLEKGLEIHHWNYNKKYLKDIFILKRSEHKKVHTFIKFDYNSNMFLDIDGNLLDTKEKHLLYLTSKGIKL